MIVCWGMEFLLLNPCTIWMSWTAELNRRNLIKTSMLQTKQAYHSAEDPVTWGHRFPPHYWSQAESHEKSHVRLSPTKLAMREPMARRHTKTKKRHRLTPYRPLRSSLLCARCRVRSMPEDSITGHVSPLWWQFIRSQPSFTHSSVQCLLLNCVRVRRV